MANAYFTSSAYKERQINGISKRRINLMEMKAQNIYAGVIIMNFIIDQTIIGIIQLNYDNLGAHNVFIIWWVFHLWEIIEVHVIANILIIKDAWKHFEEFNGFVAATFPGQEKPRPIIIEQKEKEKNIQEQSPGKSFLYLQNSDNQRTFNSGSPVMIVVEIH